MTSTTTAEARDRLRVALSCWPVVDEATRAFLTTLPWRRRQVAILVYAERLSIRDVAARIARSEATVERDLGIICRAYRRTLQRS
jgi:DNA-directed RNA polymerase specialized sigma24 family protein